MAMLASLGNTAYSVLWLEKKIGMYSSIWISLLPNVPLCVSSMQQCWLETTWIHPVLVASAVRCCRAFVCKGQVYTETMKKDTAYGTLIEWYINIDLYEV